MIFAALVLFFPFPPNGDNAKVVDVSRISTDVATAASVSSASASSPSEVAPVASGESSSNEWIAASTTMISMPEARASAEAAPLAAQPYTPNPAARPASLRPAFYRSYERPVQRKLWYGLAAAGHSAAVFDAWTTRRAISGGYGTEADPIMRPFANSAALYAATQVSPLLMDYLGRRMMINGHPWVRRMWWVPQAVGAAMSFGSGVHNMGVVH